ncbi:MAG: tripartite tricarboxylate transporter substrate binding protein [Hyphomicrobiaceae bacterium]|nr:tripartite tricarboxylate transporter substrate binding protein [Hyphomicrobiaceae bacterium]
MRGATGTTRRRILALVALALWAFGLDGSADAQQAYPSQPIRFVIAFGPGGVADTTSRIVAEQLSDKLGQRVVVENNPGGGGIAAARAVLSAPADGHTLALLTNGTSISVSLFKNLTFDPLTEFAPVSKLGAFEFFFAVKADASYRALAELVKAARDNPGKLNIGTVNPGSTQHLCAMMLKSTAGIEFQWVPFKNSGDLIVALLRGDVDAGVDAFAAFRGNIDDGKLRALATTAPKPFPLLPNVPPAREAGAGDFETTAWNGLFVKAGTPPEIVAQLNKVVAEVLSDPDLKQKLLGMGIIADPSSPEALAAFFKRDIAKWAEVIEKNKIEKR